MQHMIQSRRLMTVVLIATVVCSVPTQSAAQTPSTSPRDTWAELSTLRLETRVKLTLVDGGEVTGKLVQVTSDAVTLKDYETGKSGIRTSSGSSPKDDMTFLRSQVQTLEILNLSRAQSIAFSDLRARLKPGDRVYVTDTTGKQATGRLVDIGPSAVRVRVEGTERAWAAAEVTELGRRSDSPFMGGSFMGLGIGVGLAVLPAVAFRETGPILTGAMFGYGIGVGIDALIRHRVPLYWAPFQQRVSVAPILTREKQGARIAFRF